MSTAAVLLDTEKALILHGTLADCVTYLNWIFRLVLSSVLALFLQKKFNVSVEGEISTPREMRAGMP
jgi:short subunit fatty acids transporter